MGVVCRLGKKELSLDEDTDSHASSNNKHCDLGQSPLQLVLYFSFVNQESGSQWNLDSFQACTSLKLERSPQDFMEPSPYPPNPRGMCLPKPLMNFWLTHEPKAVPFAATFVGLPRSASQGVSLCLPHLNEGTGGTVTANDSAFGIWIIN